MTLGYGYFCWLNQYLFSMMTSSIWNIFRVTGPLWGDPNGQQWIPLTKASDANLDVFFDRCLNKRLSTQSRRQWFEMPSRSLWHHCNALWFRLILTLAHFVPCDIIGFFLLMFLLNSLWPCYVIWRLGVICLVNVGSSKGLSLVRCQPISFSNFNLFVDWTIGNNSQWNWIKKSKVLLHENAFESIIYITW